MISPKDIKTGDIFYNYLIDEYVKITGNYTSCIEYKYINKNHTSTYRLNYSIFYYYLRIITQIELNELIIQEIIE